MQEQKVRENYIYKMNAKKNQKEYGGTSSAGAKTFGGDSTPKAVNSVYSSNAVQIKNTGPNAEMATVKPKKESTFQKVENQTVDLIDGKRKSMFDWLDEWSNLGGGPNKESAETAKIKGKEKADLNASAQAKSPFVNPILDYDDMINPPDKKYQKDENYWRRNAYEGYGENNEFINNTIKEYSPLNRAELRTISEKPLPYIKNLSALLKAKNNVVPIKNDIFYYNENELTEMNNSKIYSKYAAGLDGGLPNAFQHMFLAALITDAVGADEARKFLTAHETFSDVDYDNNILAQQQEIPIEKDTEYYSYDKMYPTKLHHAAMDLHNNDLGIQIALSTPNNQKEIEKELSMLLGKGETIGYLRHAYAGLSDRQILIMKKALKAIEDGEAAIIWDFHE